MKILYIHQYFRTPYEPGGTRSYWISQELIKNGHEVTMLTTTERTMKSSVERETIDDINIVYINVPYHNAMGFMMRLISFLRFMLKSLEVAWREKNVDLVVATSTPLTVGFPALVLKKIKRIPFVFEVRDLWPEVPVQMGGLKNKALIFIAEWFEKTIYKNALHIVALSPGMYEGVVEKKIDKEKVSMIPNMSKIDSFWPREKNLDLMAELGLSECSFKVAYFGAMGASNDMELILNAGRLLKERKDIEFLFMGHGAMESVLKKSKEEEGLSNLNFYGNIAMSRLSEIVNFCDVSLVTFSNLPILATNSPNKLFDSLSAGKPIIVNSPGWTKDLVEKYECGIFVEPENPKNLADKILFLKNNPELVKKMGKNARLLAETKYDKSILCEEFADMIDAQIPQLKKSTSN
ncbi:glycosyltransferase family 4 protein [Maribacter algicola]|uniref:Glycosyltransferase family 4 protein n=1 Tax=Meishania litoralis TaxID=3434685 RepID=A0ACC7LTQ2_9FLAO